MNNDTHNLSDEAFAQQILQRARTIQPDASFATDLEQTLVQAASQQKPVRSSVRHIRTMGTLAAVFVVVIIATFNVPSLRAIAREIIGLLIRFEDDETTGYFMEQPPQQLFASLEKAETDLGRDFLVPQYFPFVTMANKVIPVEFRLLTYTPERSSVQIEYSLDVDSMWLLTLIQTPRDVYYGHGPTSIGASAEIEPVAFNFKGKPVTGQFVRGGWYSVIDVDEPDELLTATPSSINLEWTTESKEMYLIWEADGVVYQFFTREIALFEMNRDVLIRIAESIE